MLKLKKIGSYVPRCPVITVGIADYKVGSNPKVLATYALGSCVAIALYSRRSRVGALIHAMLPEPKEGLVDNPAKYVSTAIPKAIKDLEKLGVRSAYELEACIVGGANILKSTSHLRIGQRNVETARKVLSKYGVRITCEDVGGNISRNIFFDLTTGEVYVTSPKARLGHGLGRVGILGGGRLWKS